MTRDAGLQPERTALAWTRTSVAMGLNASLVVRMGLQSKDRAIISLGLVVILAALMLYGAGHYRRRLLSQSVMVPPMQMMFLSGACVAFAASAAAVALVT